MGYDPLLALYHFFVSPLLSLYGWSALMVKPAPLIMIGVGLAVGFRANVWTTGAQGQLTMGAVAGGVVALAFWGEETARSAEHKSELQSLMRISYAVFRLQKTQTQTPK